MIQMRDTAAKIPDAIDTLNSAFARPLMTQWANDAVYAKNTATRAQAIHADAKTTRHRRH